MHPTVPPLQPIVARLTLPFQTISIDFITNLPLSHGFDTCLIVVDHNSTKGVIIIPCVKSVNAIETSKLLHQHMYKQFGLPERTISDRGPQFASIVMKELNKLLGMSQTMSTAYHPQTDGQTERINQEVEAYLHIFCSQRPETWSDYAADIEVTHNQRTAQGRNESPFFLMMGFNPHIFPSITKQTALPVVETRLDELQKAREEAKAAHELARSKMMSHLTRGFVPFTKGQKVWLEAVNLRREGNKKFLPKREGPFVISEVLGTLVYKLKLPAQWRIHNVFHASLLSPFKQTDVHGPSYSEPPPDTMEGEEEYEVEAIMGHKLKWRKTYYLVKWKGYSTAENSWKPKSHLTHATAILSKYKTLHKL